MTTDAAGAVLWITGAGSGMGRAIAVRAVSAGRRVVLSGRRSEALEHAAAAIERAGGSATTLAMDTSDGDAIEAAHARISAELGPVTELVCAAGLNDPQRAWRDQSMARFDEIVQVNLVGAARVVDAVLPGMRDAGGGSIVLISSHAGWAPSPNAGVAYRASKTALRAVSESLNEQENRAGIRCCHLCPGDVATDFLDMRPEVPDAAARSRMLTADDIAASALFVLDSPAHVCVNELVVTPVKADLRTAEPAERRT